MNTVHLHWHNHNNPTDHGEKIAPLPLTIGRAPHNKLILSGKQCGVSRQHAYLTQFNEQLHLLDLNSTNGTYVAGQRVKGMPLQNGTRFWIGAYEIVVSGAVQCRREKCRQFIASHHNLCPWCGHFVTDAVTQLQGI